MSVEAILGANLGLVEAPAGCVKTHLFTDALDIAQNNPYLVLTHTTAVVAALKKRLRGVPSSNYRVATVAGWALNLANMLPAISGYISPPNSPPNYANLQQSVAALCQRGDLSDVLQASYSRLFVDEYQDCSVSQHALVCGLSQCLPTIVFGDVLQAIFGFGGDPLPSWANDVQPFFPKIATLDTPWRWNNAGTHELGQWILYIRQQLLRGDSIDLLSCPNYIFWNQVNRNARVNLQAQIDMQYRIRRDMSPNETLLVIGDSRNVSSRHEFARNIRGMGVVEPVDLTDIVTAARGFDSSQAVNLLNLVLDVASRVMTGVDKAALLNRVQVIMRGSNRNPPSPVECAAITVLQESNPSSILQLLNLLKQKEGARIYRNDALGALHDSLALSISDPTKSIHQSSSIIRERRRHRGDKRIPSRAIGSTLLLKGLESDHVLILNADDMNAKHLYVALSRGAKSVTLFSSNTNVL